MYDAPVPAVEAGQAMAYAEYLALERESELEHEYVGGVAVLRPGGTPEHARLAVRVSAQLLASLAGRPCEVFSSDLRVRNVAADRSSYPDVTVICGRIERAKDDNQAVTNPRIIVEVLSDTTEIHDRGDKWRDYRRLSSLQAYVLVSQTEPLVEVYRRGGDVWQYEAAGPGQVLRVDDEGASLDVDALYRSGLE